MSAMPEDLLAAAEALLNDEFNSGVSEPVQNVEPAGAPEPEDTPELTVDAQGRAHGPDGKFVAQDGDEDSAEEDVPADAGTEDEAEEPEAQEVEATADDELVFELDDPEIIELLDKYDGDVIKALKASREAQSLIGRQGSELGEVRKELEKLREAMQQAPPPQQYFGPYRSDVDENPEGLVQEVLERAMVPGGQFDEATYAVAIEAWGEIEPFKAASLNAQVQMALQVAAQAVATGPPPEETSAGATLESEFTALKERHPDVENHLPGIEKVLAERPHLAAAVAEGDPRARAQAFEDAYLLARSQSKDSDTSAAARKIILKTKAEVDQAKADATVVRASRSSAAEVGPKANETLEQALRDLSGLTDLVIE